VLASAVARAVVADPSCERGTSTKKSQTNARSPNPQKETGPPPRVSPPHASEGEGKDYRGQPPGQPLQPRQHRAFEFVLEQRYEGAGVTDQRADHIRPSAACRSRGRGRRRAWRLSECERSQTNEEGDDLGDDEYRLPEPARAHGRLLSLWVWDLLRSGQYLLSVL